MAVSLRKVVKATRRVLAVAILLCGVSSFLGGLGGFNIGQTSFWVLRGLVEVRHVTSYGAPIPADQWPGDPIPAARIMPPRPSFPWVRYVSHHQVGNVDPSGEVWPADAVVVANCWMLYFPVWLPAIVLALPGIRSLAGRVRATLASRSLRPEAGAEEIGGFGSAGASPSQA